MVTLSGIADGSIGLTLPLPFEVAAGYQNRQPTHKRRNRDSLAHADLHAFGERVAIGATCGPVEDWPLVSGFDGCRNLADDETG